MKVYIDMRDNLLEGFSAGVMEVPDDTAAFLSVMSKAGRFTIYAPGAKRTRDVPEFDGFVLYFENEYD
jgi:hypothetical protein